jgi:hypothetical protein
MVPRLWTITEPVMGMKTRATFEEALLDAHKIVGSSPSVLALPKAFKTASVHLCLKDA